MATDPSIIGTGPFDKIIIEGFAAYKSAEQVAEDTSGVFTPAQCLARLNQLVRSTDVLDAKMRLNLLLQDTYWVRNKLRKQMEEPNYFLTKDDATILLKTTDAIVTQIEKANIGLNEAMLRFNEVRAAEFIEALGFITAKMMEILADRHPEIEMADLNMVVLEAIPDAIPDVQ
jgi:hypothetical protein